MSLEDLEKALMEYSELEVVNDIENVVPPESIRKYTQQMKYNNSIGMYWLSHDLVENTTNNNSWCDTKEEKYFGKESLTYVSTGRGRGMQNSLIKPGEVYRGRTSDEDEVRNAIRKVHGIGYGNGITEAYVRSHQLANQLKKQQSENINRIFTTSQLKAGSTSNDNETASTSSKKVPSLSSMLKQAREDRKKLKRDKINALNNNNNNSDKVNGNQSEAVLISKKSERPWSNTSSNKYTRNYRIMLANYNDEPDISNNEQFPPLPQK